KRLETIYMDGRRFLKTTKRHYDIIMINLPIPSTLQLNRFYTKEFFENVRSSLKDNGIFAFRLLGSLSYLSPELRDLNGSILNTLKDVFFPVVIPGYSNIYLASRRELNIGPKLLLKRLEERGIPTKIFNKSYLEDRLNPEWLKWFKRSLSSYTTLRKNSDLRPIGTYYAVSYWNSLFSPRFQTLVRTWAKIKFLPLLLALAICGALLSAITLFIPQPKKYSTGLAIFSTGFTGMSLNLILIYAYQSFYGFVFYHIALLISAFMIGLTLGGWLITRSLSRIKNDLGYFLRIESFGVFFSLGMGFFLVFLNHSGMFRFSAVFFLLSAVAGFFIGAEFPLAAKIYLKDKIRSEAGGLLYALDLLGSWLAALFVSAALVPLIGILPTCILLAVLKTASLVAIGLSKN
ncbi:MAG: hypothetical protein PHP46_02500, partial [Candidatus Omnitrophica bacterium]|nr:hypothetical protein [Candidatus Omnitrophota bacterium]